MTVVVALLWIGAYMVLGFVTALLRHYVWGAMPAPFAYICFALWPLVILVVLPCAMLVRARIMTRTVFLRVEPNAAEGWSSDSICSRESAYTLIRRYERGELNDDPSLDRSTKFRPQLKSVA